METLCGLSPCWIGFEMHFVSDGSDVVARVSG